MLERPTTSGQAARRERDRRYRARVRRGEMVITICVGPLLLDMLCRLHWLNGSAVEHSRAEIRDAVERMLGDTARRS
jgi:hypothetical protein